MNRNEWKECTLGAVAKIERRSVQPECIKPGSLYVGLEHIDSGGRIREVTTVEYGDLASSKFEFGPQHLLYGKLRPYLSKIAAPNFEGICSTDILPISPGPQADRNYLLHYLRQEKMVAWSTARSTGANLPRISPKVLETMPIKVPSLDEQRRIAAVLDQADALRDKRRQALAQVENLVEAIFEEMFPPYSFPIEPLEVLFSFKTGKLNSNAAVADGQYKFFTCDREDSQIDHYAFDQEALILSGNNASGDYTVKFYSGKFNAYQRTYVISVCSKLTYSYARVAMQRQLMRLKHISKGSATKYLTLASLNRLELSVPPLALQQEFARRVEAIERLKAAHRRFLEEMDALFASLQHRAFRGEL